MNLPFLLSSLCLASSFAVSSLPYTGLSQKFVGVQNVSIYQRAGYVPFRLSGSNYPTIDDGKIDIYFYFDTKLASVQNSTYLVANDFYFGDQSQLVVSDIKPTDYNYISFLTYRVLQSDNTYTYFFELTDCNFSNSSFSFAFVQRSYNSSTQQNDYFPSVSSSVDENGKCSDVGLQFSSKHNSAGSSIYINFSFSVSTILNVDTSLAYNQGYENGKNDWYRKGWEDGEKSGIEKGKEIGASQDFTTNALTSLVNSILTAPYTILKDGLNFEFFGINFGAITFSLITVALVAMVISFLIGKFK